MRMDYDGCVPELPTAATTATANVQRIRQPVCDAGLFDRLLRWGLHFHELLLSDVATVQLGELRFLLSFWAGLRRRRHVCAPTLLRPGIPEQNLPS
jgi:hypothetical protein